MGLASILAGLLAGAGLTSTGCKRTPPTGSAGAAISVGDGPKGCTRLPCSDELRITVTAEEKAIPSGFQRIDVTVDDTEISCAFPLPPATADETMRTISAECQPGLTADIGPATLCTTTRTGNSVSQTCTPIPGRIKETLHIVGMPKLVKVSQVVGAGGEERGQDRGQERPVLERSETPRYGLVQPNGPGCDPTCHLAVLDWTIP